MTEKTDIEVMIAAGVNPAKAEEYDADMKALLCPECRHGKPRHVDGKQWENQKVASPSPRASPMTVRTPAQTGSVGHTGLGTVRATMALLRSQNTVRVVLVTCRL